MNLKKPNANADEISLSQVRAIPTLMRWRAEVILNVFGVKPSPRLLVANRQYYRQHIADNSHLAFVVKYGENEAGCGAACFYDELPSPDNLSGKCAYIMNIYVREPFRNLGIAHAIVKRLIAEAKARNCGKIYLETTEAAKSIYESLGFSAMEGMMHIDDAECIHII